MGIGMLGMVSGLDTESIVKAMVSNYSSKKDDLTKSQTKLQWKMDAWKDMNKKVYDFYSKSVSTLRFASNYTKKKTTISDSSVAKITSTANSVNGTQSLAIKQLAKAGYLTGGKVQSASGTVKNSTKLGDLSTNSAKVEDGATIDIEVAGKKTTISLDKDKAVGTLVAELKEAGVEASFDVANQRFFISAKTSGVANDFKITAGNEKGTNALKALGLNASMTQAELAEYQRWANMDETAKNAEIERRYAAASKYTDDKSKAELEAANSNMQNALYQAEYLSELKNGSTALDDKDAVSAFFTGKADALLDEIKKANEDANNDLLTEAEREAAKEKEKELNDKIAALKDIESKCKVNGEYDKDTINDLSITTTNSEGKSFSDIIAANKDIIDDNPAGALAAYTEKKNTEIKNNITAQVEAKIEEATSIINGASTASTNANGEGATRVEGQNAIIFLNDAKFEGSDNTITVNGLSITATETTGVNADGSLKTVSITTSDDTDSIYDMIKDFFSEYNALITEMDKAYNATSSKGFEPLTDEEKEAMSEDEVEKWETKIKDSILRKDSTLNTVSQAMKEIMQKPVTINGKKVYLSDFGIGTQSYFSAPDNEKAVIHIDGDEDDTVSAGNKDKLKSAILTDPDKVVSFFSQLSKNLYKELTNKMKATKLSSTYTLYNDKQMQSEYSTYTSKISKQEELVQRWEDYYYKQFTAMEKTLSELNAQQSSLGGLLGGGN